MRQCGFAAPKSEQAHAYLWLRLSNCGHPDLAHAGVELNDLRSQRNWADYDFDLSMDQSTAADFVQAARDVVSLLEQAAALPTVQSQITAVIRVYERDVLVNVTWQPSELNALRGPDRDGDAQDRVDGQSWPGSEDGAGLTTDIEGGPA